MPRNSGEVVNMKDVTTQLDTDGDGVSDNLDLAQIWLRDQSLMKTDALEQKDSDGDGVNDAEDAFPDNASRFR